MTEPTGFPPPAPKHLLPHWVGVVFPITLLGAAGILALQATNRVWLPITVTIGAAAGLGLLAGFAARWSVRHRTRLFRWGIALGGLTIGLLVAGLLSRGTFGVGPLYPLRQEIDWSDVAQILIGALTSWLAVMGFSRTQPSAGLGVGAEESVEAGVQSPIDAGGMRWTLPDPGAVDETRPNRVRRRPTPDSVAAAALAERSGRAASAARRRSHARLALASPLRTGLGRLRDRLGRAASWRPRLGWFTRRRAETPIRFTGSGEDRCPYCLDVIDPKDPRGVTRCPVCHTPHHADCWSITGMCQMPHLYGEGHSARSGVAR